MTSYARDEPRHTDDDEGKLFVGGLAWESDEASIKDYFGQWGPVESVTLKRNKEDPTKHRGFCFVKYFHQSSADACLSKDSHILDGSKIDPKSACPIGVKPEQRTKKIFVGGLQTETTDDALRDYFSQFGEILNNIEYALDHHTKKKRGFCFIEFANEGMVDRIVKDKYHYVAGKKLETKRALTKQQQQEMAAQSATTRLPARAAALSYAGLPIATAGAAYAQPVIYIHPDSLSTSYPLQALGITAGLSAGYPVASTGYTTSLESLYSPYGGTTGARDSRDSRDSRPAPVLRWINPALIPRFPLPPKPLKSP
ncbi:heterogeneous nuclear ribonucleoprotein A/B-like isoform X1 [Clytia hemisphaerica]|uniref:RRM domain-containing protein n=1 Tax=Clytia hemisphaerica TaxID=252671 RepID=A0A7M5XIX7_9CNID